MKKFLLAAAALALALTAQAQTLTGSYGTGSAVSYLVIQGTAFSTVPLWYEFHYDYNPTSPLNTYSMLTTIIAGDPLLDAVFINYGDEESPNYFLDSISYNGMTLTNTGAPAYEPYWAQWVSGGESGYPMAEPIASGSWSYGSGLSDPYRYLAPGSWDGFVYNAGFTPPDMAPVPEPQSWVLLLLGGALIVGFIRRKPCAG